MENTQIQTEGQRLVGVTFNLSGDPNVNKAKQLCAELFDLLNSNYNNRYVEGNLEKGMCPGFEDPLKETIFQTAIGDILKTQMLAVKLLTWK